MRKTRHWRGALPAMGFPLSKWASRRAGSWFAPMRRGDDDFPVFPVFPPDLFCGGHWEVKLTFRTFRKCATPLEPDAVLDPGPLEALPDGFPSVYDRFRRFM